MIDRSEGFFRYTQDSSRLVHNANLLGAGFVAAVGGLTRRAELIESSLHAARVSVEAQHAEGWWAYGRGAGLGWVDSFHTAYDLDGLLGVWCATGDRSMRDSLERGVADWTDNFFGPLGEPYYYRTRKLPLEIHSASSAVDLLARLAAHGLDTSGLADRVAAWTRGALIGPEPPRSSASACSARIAGILCGGVMPTGGLPRQVVGVLGGWRDVARRRRRHSESCMSRVFVFGIDLDLLDRQQSLARCIELIERRQPAQHVVVNAGKVVQAQDNAELREIIRGADIVNADGIAVVWAGRFLGHSVPERVAGIDLMETLLEAAQEHEWPVFFLGARSEVLERFLTVVRARFPRLVVAGSRNGYFEDASAVAQAIGESGARLLFLGMSSPMQGRVRGVTARTVGRDYCRSVWAAASMCGPA